MNRIAVVGGICCDISGKPYTDIIERDSNPSHITVAAGGVGFNIAKNLVKLGRPVTLICAVGDDPLGALLIRSAKEVCVDLISFPAERSGVYLCANDADGDMFLALSDLDCTESVLSPENLSKCLDFLNSCEAVVIDCNISAEAIGYLCEIITVPIFADPVSSAKAMRLRPYIGRLAAIKPNLLEARALTGKVEPADCAAAIIGMGAKSCFVSCGADGIYFASEKVCGHAEAKPVDVIATTGAGDAAAAAIIDTLLKTNDVAFAAETASINASKAIGKEL